MGDDHRSHDAALHVRAVEQAGGRPRIGPWSRVVALAVVLVAVLVVAVGTNRYGWTLAFEDRTGYQACRLYAKSQTESDPVDVYWTLRTAELDAAYASSRDLERAVRRDRNGVLVTPTALATACAAHGYHPLLARWPH